MMYAPRMPPMPKQLSQSPLGRKNGNSPKLNLQKQYSQIVSQYQDLLDLLIENNRLYDCLAHRFDQLSWQFNSFVNEQSKTGDISATVKPATQPVVQLLVPAMEEAVTAKTESKEDVIEPKEEAVQIAEKDSETEDGKTDNTKKTDAKKVRKRKDRNRLQKCKKYAKKCAMYIVKNFAEGTLEFLGQAAGFKLGFVLCPPTAPLLGYIGRKLGGKLGGLIKRLATEAHDLIFAKK